MFMVISRKSIREAHIAHCYRFKRMYYVAGASWIIYAITSISKVIE